jgi:hypothetical protein
MAISEKHSFKDYTGLSLKGYDKSDFTNQTIKGTCFSQEKTDSDIFPDGTANVTFIRCNLDNVVLPSGSTIDGETINRRIKVQNDLMDWEVDEQDNPIRPADPVSFDKVGLSKKPVDIPSTKLEKPIIHDKEKVK